MTAPSQISVRPDGLFLGWRDENAARHGSQTLQAVGPAALMSHEDTMFAPAAGTNKPGQYLAWVPGTDYGSLLRAVGTPHDSVRVIEPKIHEEMAAKFLLNELGSKGITGGDSIAAGQQVANNAAMGTIAETVRTV